MTQVGKATTSRMVGFVDEAASIPSERPDSEAQKVIESIEYLPKIRAFLVRMGHGGIYLLKLDDLSEADSSPVVRSRIGRDRTHFKVWQESGNQLAIPWDVVLYHCESEYEYHKSRSTHGQDKSRAVQIGTRVREVRLARGLTISELAQKSGMKRPNLSRLEHGRQAPSLDTLEQIAASLMVPLADLVRDVHWPL